VANLQPVTGWADDLRAPIEAASPFGWLPLDNLPALAAYYLGIFALVPIFGLPFAAAAVWEGLDGRRQALTDHRTGSGHALAGLALGVLSLAGHLVAALWLTVSLAPLAG
jgi:hypothetical protein